MKTLIKHKNAFILSIFTVLAVSIFSFSDRFMLLVEAHNLIPYSINWSNTNLITTDDFWNVNVELGVRGYSGADLAAAPGTDARTVLADSKVINVRANQTNPNTLVEGGVAEFEIANPTIAIKGSDTARAPYVNLLMDSLGLVNIRVRANVRDLSTVNDSVQQVAVQYRTDEIPGLAYVNLPSAYIADATDPGTATKVTPIDITLPPDANNIQFLEIRIMTVNAAGSDEWIGIDDIQVTGTVAPENQAKFDFDGDGRSDIAVYRPSNNVWYIQQSTAGFTSIGFGASGDLIAPADFDGDGKTDVAVFRPSNGVWYLQRSQLGFTGIGFGANGDIPMPADYDGDGKADLAVFRPSSGAWYIQQSTAGFLGITFGTNGDVPVAEDYDGDGKADIAVFRPSNNFWYVNRSQLGFTSVAFGASGDKPAAADYDGDGKADVAVFRPSNGTWYLQQSTAGFTAIGFGANGDAPVPGDYDGDGKADVSVFRPTNGGWYLNQSTQGFRGIAFGANGDEPAPNAFIP